MRAPRPPHEAVSVVISGLPIINRQGGHNFVESNETELMPERTADVQAHWTRRGVLARIDAALAELGQDPQILNPEILATVEHLHSGGLATTREQAKRIALTKDSRVLDVGCGIGGPARYLAHTYGCRVDGIDLTPELIETGRVLTKRCKLADRVALRKANFQSVRSAFKFNNNHFPIQNLYIMEVKKGENGNLKAALKDTAINDWQDPYHQECPMKS
jgi:SAM-dependent methyltransferase